MMKTTFLRVGGAVLVRPSIRTFTLSSSSSASEGKLALTFRQLQKNGSRLESSPGGHGSLQTTGLRLRGVHDERKPGDDELLSFLEEEMLTERKMQRVTCIPSTFHDFNVKADKSEITMSKIVGDEEITISTNVNHSVDAAEYDRDDLSINKTPDASDPAKRMRSKPNFDVAVKKGKQILSFNCSFLQNENEELDRGADEFADIFVIDEVSIYEGEWKSTDYSVAGDILDGYLYDLYMNFLENRGISNEFVEKLSELCTDYEHNLYIELLARMQEFCK